MNQQTTFAQWSPAMVLVTVTESMEATGASAPLIPLNWMGWTRWDRLADALSPVLCAPQELTVTACVTMLLHLTPLHMCMTHREHSSNDVPPPPGKTLF